MVNDPASVRNAPEKLFVLRFPELMPPTLLTLNRDEIKAFWDEHGEIILKPLFGNGGAGIVHLRPGDDNLSSLVEMYQQMYREPIMVQRYIPEVRKGDKRIVLIDGEAAGGVLRVPAEGEARANLHVGGRGVKTALTAREKEICAAIGPTLKEQGLLFVGIDVIGDYMTEINVTSPTGIQEIGRLNNTDNLAAKIWDAIERRRSRPARSVTGCNLADVIATAERSSLGSASSARRGRRLRANAPCGLLAGTASVLEDGGSRCPMQVATNAARESCRPKMCSASGSMNAARSRSPGSIATARATPVPRMPGCTPCAR